MKYILITYLSICTVFAQETRLTPELFFGSLVMGETLLTSEYRPWTLAAGSFTNARGAIYTITRQELPPRTLVEKGTSIPYTPIVMDLTPHIGKFLEFYRLDAIDTRTFGYFVLSTPGDDYYRTPKETIRISAEIDTQIWLPSIKKISFHYQGQWIGTLKKDTPSHNGRQSINETFQNPKDRYIDPEEITYTLHYAKSKSEGHKLNPSGTHNIPDLANATSSTKVPHAIRLIINASPITNDLNISYKTKSAPKAQETQPSPAINLQPQITTAEHDPEILDQFKLSPDTNYMTDYSQALASQNYTSYLDIARAYLIQAAQKHGRDVHIPSSLRILRTYGYIPSSVYIGLIYLDLKQGFKLEPSDEYFPHSVKIHSD